MRLGVLVVLAGLVGCSGAATCKSDADCEAGAHCDAVVKACFQNAPADGGSGSVSSTAASSSSGTGSSSSASSSSGSSGSSGSSTSASSSSGTSSSTASTGSSGGATSSGSGGTTGANPVFHSYAADATPIAFGDSTTLRWSIDDAQSISIDQGLGVQTGTSVTVSPTTTTTYTLTAHGATRDLVVQTTVGVTPKIVSFTASPSPVDPGQTSTLLFDVRGSPVGTWTIDQGIGNVTSLSQVSTGQLTQTRTFTLTATNAAGTVTATATAHVNIQIAVTPTTDPILLPEQTAPFAATLVGNANTAVTWSLQEGSVAGLIDASGVYTAGWTSGVYHVVATSVADPTYSASALVTVSRPASGTIDTSFADGGIFFGAPGTEADAVTIVGTDIYYAATVTDGGSTRMYLGKLTRMAPPIPPSQKRLVQKRRSSPLPWTTVRQSGLEAWVPARIILASRSFVLETG